MQRKPNKFNHSHSLRTLGLALTLGTLLTTTAATAQTDQTTIEELKAQIAAMAARLEQLEASNQTTTAAIEETRKSATVSSWADNVKITGDLRTRYENIDDASKPEARERSRIRARLALTAQVNDDWKYGLGFASGDGDPISTNQTLGNGAGNKNLNIDFAYFEWTGRKNLMVTGGKFKNPFYRAGGQSMMFDGDYRPEGLGVKYDNSTLFMTAGTMFLESDNKAGSQSVASVQGLQFGYRTSLDAAAVVLGASYYDAGVAGKKPFYNNLSYGNFMDASGAYLNDYRDLEVFAEAKFTVANKPLSFYGDYVTNTAADRHNKGWAVGSKFGSVSGAHTWEAGYMYQDLQADAVFGAFTDSDFAGGGTDGKGHLIDFAYGIGRNTQVGGSLYLNEYGQNHGNAIDYNRFHLFVINSF